MADTPTLARELDDIDRKLQPLRARLAVVWRSIEHSRHGVIRLDPGTYTQRKIELGNLQGAICDLEPDLFVSRGCYYGLSRADWLRAQAETPRKCSLAQLWQRWRAVLVARQALADLGDDATTRERIDAEINVEAAEGLYDTVSRRFEGKEPRTHEERCTRLKISPPKRPLPGGSNKRASVTRSTYIGA